VASDVNPQRLALVRLLSAVANISAWGGGQLFTINVVFSPTWLSVLVHGPGAFASGINVNGNQSGSA
jgi:hypothetical protein